MRVVGRVHGRGSQVRIASARDRVKVSGACRPARFCAPGGSLSKTFGSMLPQTKLNLQLLCEIVAAMAIAWCLIAVNRALHKREQWTPTERHIWSAIGTHRFIDFKTKAEYYVTAVFETNVTSRGVEISSTYVTNGFDRRTWGPVKTQHVSSQLLNNLGENSR